MAGLISGERGGRCINVHEGQSLRIALADHVFDHGLMPVIQLL